MRHTDLKNNNKGFALTGVMVILLILTFMGASLYAYSMISLRSVRFLSDQKKAEYLARAGVEASSYAYKLAVDSNDTNANNLIINSANAGDEIKAEPIYLTYKRGSANPYEYVSKTVADSRLSDSSYKVIGYYDVTIINRTEERTVNFLQTDTEKNITAYETTIKDKQRQFKCVGHAMSGGKVTASSTKFGHMSEPVQGSGMFYDSEGANAGVVDGSANGSTATNQNFSVIGSYKTNNILLFKTKHFGTAEIPIGERNIPLVMGYSSGNMILNAPIDSYKNKLPIKFNENSDNIVTFAAVNDLFVKSDVDVTSKDSHFNIITLKGNNIVIEGNIEISVYGFTQGSGLQFINNISTAIDAWRGKYRLGTLVLGTPDFNTSTVIDNKKLDPKDPNSPSLGRCGRVYFGGNVFINITMPNVGTYRYLAFSPGEAYYFQDSIDSDGDGVEEAYGVDLLKYFLDDAIANKKYSENVLERFQDLKDLYYTNGDKAPDSYVEVDSNNKIISNAMRKIDRDKYGDSFRDLVPPDPTDASTFRWGE